METVSSQFMKAWPQTDVFNADSQPRSHTAPQHGASSPQDSQNSSVGAAEHPWVQEQLKPISKKKTTKEKKYGGEKCAKSPDMRGTLELCVCVCVFVFICMRTRERHRGRQRANSDLLWTVWVCWGSSKYQERGQII